MGDPIDTTASSTDAADADTALPVSALLADAADHP